MPETKLQDFPRAVPVENRSRDDDPSRTVSRTGHATGVWRGLARGFWVALLSVAVLAGGYAGQQYLIATKKEPNKRAVREKVAFVRTVPVVFGDYQPTLRLYGETVAGRQVELRALVAGEVQSVGDGLRDGGEVSAGDLLLTINPFNYEGAIVETTASLAEARGRLEELKATSRSERDGLKRDREQLAIAIKDVKKTAALVRRNAVSARLLDERELVLSQRRQSVELKQNNLRVQASRMTQQEATINRLSWSLKQAQQRLAETRLAAPFNAYVSEVNADVGRMLGASDRVAKLFDRDWIEARFVLTDQQYGRIVAAAKDDGQELIGRSVKVIWRVGSTPVEFDAAIVRVGATIASSQGGVTMFARIKDPTKPIAIRPGAFVEVESSDRRYQAVARLPQTAVYDNRTVYVVKGERLEAREIQVIGADGRFILVKGAADTGTAEGKRLAAGDRVVTTRLSTIGSGLKVEDVQADG